MSKSRNHLSLLSEKAADIWQGRVAEQSAAICYRMTDDGDCKVKLITSRDTGRWVIPKGNIEQKETARQAAARETKEEAGLTGKVSKKPFGYYTYLKIREGIPCIVSVYLIRVTNGVEKCVENDQRTREWVDIIEASRRVDEPELKSLFIRFYDFYRSL